MPNRNETTSLTTLFPTGMKQQANLHHAQQDETTSLTAPCQTGMKQQA